MADVHSREVRSFNMSRIRSKDTKPEIIVRKALFAEGFRFRVHDRRYPGSPDIVLKKHRAVIFIHGCFWHGHKDCKYFKIPQTRTQWWQEKIARNKYNDRIAIRALKRDGWKVIILWECDLKSDKMTKTLNKLAFKILA